MTLARMESTITMPSQDSGPDEGEGKLGAGVEDGQVDGVRQQLADGHGQQGAQHPADQADQHAFDDHHVHHGPVRSADGAHHADLAGAVEHVHAHRAHQADAADDRGQERP